MNPPVIAGEKTEKTYREKEKVIAGGKPKKTFDNKPVSIIIEINTLCSGAT